MLPQVWEQQHLVRRGRAVVRSRREAQAMEAARTFRPTDKAKYPPAHEMTALARKYEPFKTTAKFDGTANIPEWTS